MPMLRRKMEQALNGQVNAEFYSAYLYLSMRANFAAQNWVGAAQWMRVQAGEELGHAMKIHDFVLECGSTAALDPIAKPPSEWPTLLAAFEAAYAHERKVTGLIHGLVKQAEAENDSATASFLQWFVREQVEEEEHSLAIVQQLRQIAESKEAMFAFDRELGKRV
jgi:ferritin